MWADRWCSCQYLALYMKYPSTKLGQMARSDHADRLLMCHGYDEQNEQYLFYRPGTLFQCIADLYHTGRIHLLSNVCPEHLLTELSYWEVSNTYISQCCLHKLPLQLESEAAGSESTPVVNGSVKSKSEEGIGGKYNMARRMVWSFLENPGSSRYALVFVGASCVMVILTVIVLVMSSMPSFQVRDPATNETMDEPGLVWADTWCVAWFTAEYCLRLWSAPNRWVYFRSPLSIIDLGAIMPFYVELILNHIGIDNVGFGDIRRSLVMVRVLRVLRVLRALRVLKVARYSTGFQSMGSALQRSWRELVLLLMFMLTANLMFSTAMYYVEVDHPYTHFPSIPDACWWSIITMTTVGYGDVYPKTPTGKIIASIVSITGIVLLAFPISVIVENFNEEYHDSNKDTESKSLRAVTIPERVPVAAGAVVISPSQGRRPVAAGHFPTRLRMLH